jgi:glycoprotein 6-alpha-L-fucosyltransferase
MYSKEKGWEGAFLPLSETCTTATGAVPWDAHHDTKQVVSLPFVDSFRDPPPFMPQAIPKELADKLFTFHQHPWLWFAGQILLYLLRPNEQLKRFIADRKKALNIKKPYAGVQVRRTDKLIEEAKLHRLDEYMVRVEEWYRLYGMTHEVDKKRVFIATDDPSVITEAKTKYTDYEVYGDDRIVQTAQTKSRYSLESLFGIIFDVYMLAESDYLSCTFSSNVGRLAFEFLQANHVDASKKATSVDWNYFFFGQRTDKQIVL